MSNLKKEFIGSIGIGSLKEIVDNLEALDMGFVVKKHALSDLPNFAYKLFVEADYETKVVKNLVIEIEK